MRLDRDATLEKPHFRILSFPCVCWGGTRKFNNSVFSVPFLNRTANLMTIHPARRWKLQQDVLFSKMRYLDKFTDTAHRYVCQSLWQTALWWWELGDSIVIERSEEVVAA